MASFTPGLVVVTAVSLRQKLDLQHAELLIGKVFALSCLYTYIFDAVNQAKGAIEDEINKPYRPIPRGLLTATDAMRRFWVVMVLYSVLGWSFSVLEWVLVWQASTITINILCPLKHYFWCKTFCMTLGVGSQLSQAWQLVSPIDEVGKRWILFMMTVYPPPLIFEDVRDMAGDKAIGRRTLALMLGQLPIRIWFACIMMMIPVLAHAHLFVPTSAALWRLVTCDVLVAVVCWTAGLRSLLIRSVKADRVTYQLFIFSYIVVLFSGCILWA